MTSVASVLLRWTAPLLFIVFLPSADEQAIGVRPSTAGGSIAGHVLDDETGAPVAGVRVTRWLIQPLDLTQFEVITDSAGRFVFHDVRPGAWRVVAELLGHWSGAYGRRRVDGPDRLVPVTEGASLTSIDIRLFRTDGALSGAVIDERGEPVVGATVRALRQGVAGSVRNGSWSLYPASALTDDRGIYELSLPTGRYAVVVPGQAVIALPESLWRTGSTAASEIRELGPTRVVTPAGPSFPFEGLRVFRGRRGAGPVAPPVGADGVWWTYPTAISPVGVAAGGSPISLAPGSAGADVSNVSVVLELVRGVRVSGRISGPQGSFKDVGVRLIPTFLSALAGSDELEAAASVSSGDGTFTLLGVAPGEYVLRVLEAPRRPVRPPIAGDDSLPSQVDPETYWAEMPLTVGSADVAELNVQIARGARLAGQIAFEGDGPAPTAEAITRLTAFLIPIDAPSRGLLDANVNADGHFVTAGYPAGRYGLSVSVPFGWVVASVMQSGKDVTGSAIDLAGDDIGGYVVTLTNRTGTLSGTVRNARQDADPDSAVLVFPANYEKPASRSTLGQRFKEVRTTQDGTFSFPGLAPGDYWAVAIDDAQASNWRGPDALARLAPLATRITVGERQHVNVDLRTQAVR